jgi:hypothetical protein
MKFCSLLLISLLAALPNFAAAQEPAKAVVVAEKAPGQAAIAEGIEVQGVITKINKKDRTVTLKGAEGKEVSFVAGPEVKRFDQAKVGDIVTITFFEALGLELKKAGAGIRERSEKTEVVRTKPGEPVGAAISHHVTVIADVIAIDAAKGKVTLRGPKRTAELTIKDPEQLKDIKVGDQVEARYVEATVVTLTPGKKK